MDTSNGGSTVPLKELIPSEVGAIISGLGGVADIEVDLRSDGSPRLRVHLDGSVPSETVGRHIRETLADYAGSSEPAPPSGERRAGLGRNLAEIIESESAAAASMIFGRASQQKRSLVLVAVEEAAGGISVRVADSDGGIAFSPVEDTKSLNQAVVSAVGRLRQERPLPRLVGVEIREVESAAVLTVVLARNDGNRAVGAALVEGGMPFTLGKAVWEALASAD